MIKPNLKLIRQWIKVLRSRKYKQGQCKLFHSLDERIEDLEIETNHGVDLYCCLGVAQKIIDPTHPCLSRGDVYLPVETLYKLGIDHDLEIVLSNKNDDGQKFYQIARFLERRFFGKAAKKD